jgi:cysteine desulfurase
MSETSAACHADGVSVSAVLEAMKVPLEWAAGTVRFSVGRHTTGREIDRAIPIIAEAVRNSIDAKGD